MVIKVYVVDDSAVVRQAFMHLLQGDPEIELMGSAPNPLIAAPVMRRTPPDVLLLDIEMPGMDGLTSLRRLMSETPIPTIICSTPRAMAAARPAAPGSVVARPPAAAGLHALAMNKPVVLGSSTGGTQGPSSRC